MKTFKRIVMLEWPESMGADWLSMDNINSLLFTPKYARKTLIQATDITDIMAKPEFQYEGDPEDE